MSNITFKGQFGSTGDLPTVAVKLGDMYICDTDNYQSVVANRTYNKNDQAVYRTINGSPGWSIIKNYSGQETGRTITLPNVNFDKVEVEIVYEDEIENNSIVVRDLTYEDKVILQTLVKTDEQILNLNPEDYGNTYQQIDIDLGTSFGGWKFGQDAFGQKVNLIKTIPLSGKGQHVKLLMIDFTKSKWTLETMGIAYKMRKARGK